ncbi:MAG: tetratricopeptide repeat protein, partial [Okeania sp. SIO2C9]|uniref:tetratricopeptide repeat protein n=1 Tax=Okeania sp. SIO2C9 TaxID=2607791 RepID=UPI0013C173FF
MLINLSRFDEAEAVFQQLIEKYPHQPQGYEGYARLNHSLGNWNLALERWESAIEKFPENIGFQVSKGNVLINLSCFDEAEVVFQRLIEKYPHQPQGYEGYARLNHSLANWNLALSRWENALKKFPEHIGFKVQKGNILINLSRFDEAEAVFQQLIEKSPHQPQGYEGYARLNHSLANWNLALSRWENALKKFPEHIGFKVQKGNILINLSRFDEAEAVFQQLIEKSPHQPQGYEGYARLNHSLGNWNLALSRWESAIEKFPENIGFQVSKGNVLINLSRFDEAEAVFQQLIEKSPHQPQGYEGYARLNHSLGNWNLALSRWENALKKFPEHIGFQVQKGNVLINLSRFDEAEAVFQQLIEKYPHQPQGYEGYARLNHSLGNWNLALERWESAIEKFPENIGFQVSKGNVLINLSCFDEAEAVFQQLIEKYPHQPQGYEGYARLNHSLANWNLALERWESAIEKFPENIGFQVSKGNVLINLSCFDEAEAVFQQLIEKYPHQPQGYEGYARLNHSLANWNLALSRWENALKKFPEHIGFQVQKGNVLINLSRFDEAEAVFQQLIEKYPHQPQGYEG